MPDNCPVCKRPRVQPGMPWDTEAQCIETGEGGSNCQRHRAESAERERDELVTALNKACEHLDSEKAAYVEATTSAFDDIAKACGCPEWEYPGQVARDVRGVVRERDAARSDLASILDRCLEAVEAELEYPTSYADREGDPEDASHGIYAVLKGAIDEGEQIGGEAMMITFREVVKDTKKSIRAHIEAIRSKP